MWRKHSCLPRRHSCRRSLPRARRSVELRLDAARRSACATTAAVKLFLRCYLATAAIEGRRTPQSAAGHRRQRHQTPPALCRASADGSRLPGRHPFQAEVASEASTAAPRDNSRILWVSEGQASCPPTLRTVRSPFGDGPASYRPKAIRLDRLDAPCCGKRIILFDLRTQLGSGSGSN